MGLRFERLRFNCVLLIAFWQTSRIFGTPGPAGPWVAFWLRFETGVCVLVAFWDLRFELRLRLRFGPAKPVYSPCTFYTLCSKQGNRF